VLEGEAGVGKSSVLRSVAARPGSDVRVLWGACDALATPRPRTASHHVAAILAKPGVRRRSEAIALATGAKDG
jgi:MoxR-like ATPase